MCVCVYVNCELACSYLCVCVCVRVCVCVCVCLCECYTPTVSGCCPPPASWILMEGWMLALSGVFVVPVDTNDVVCWSLCFSNNINWIRSQRLYSHFQHINYKNRAGYWNWQLCWIEWPGRYCFNSVAFNLILFGLMSFSLCFGQSCIHSSGHWEFSFRSSRLFHTRRSWKATSPAGGRVSLKKHTLKLNSSYFVKDDQTVKKAMFLQVFFSLGRF